MEWRVLGAQEWDYSDQGIRDRGCEQAIHHARWMGRSKQHLPYMCPRVSLWTVMSLSWMWLLAAWRTGCSCDLVCTQGCWSTDAHLEQSLQFSSLQRKSHSYMPELLCKSNQWAIRGYYEEIYYKPHYYFSVSRALPCLSFRDFTGIAVESCHCTAGVYCFQMLSTNLDRKAETVVSITLPYMHNFSHKIPSASVGLHSRFKLRMWVRLWRPGTWLGEFGRLFCHCYTVLVWWRRDFKAINRTLSKRSRLILSR